MRQNNGPTWRHVAVALGVGVLIGVATTSNLLSAAHPSTEFHDSPYAPPPLEPYVPQKQPKPYSPKVVRLGDAPREDGEARRPRKEKKKAPAPPRKEKKRSQKEKTTEPPPQPVKAQVNDDTESGNDEPSSNELEAWDLHASNTRCPSSLKVYVYEYPGMADMRWHQLAEDQRRDCAAGPCRTHFSGEHLLAQFTLEHVLHDFFSQSCLRTKNPEEADLFFVTHFGDILYRATGRKNDPSPWEQALLDLVEKGDGRAWERTFNTTSKWWTRRGGADHILVQPAPVTGLRHPKGVRGWGHYLQQLTAPVWISLELSKSFAGEYPACAKKNIVAPYPIPGKGWHNREWHRVAATARRKLLDPHLPSGRGRPLTTYFRAGDHGCVPVRKAIKRAFKEADRRRGGLGDPAFVLRAKPVAIRDEDTFRRRVAALPRQAAMFLADFCPCPEGDSPSAKRQYDAVLAGCVPVVASDDALWAFSDEAGLDGPLDPSRFSLRVSEASAASRNASLLHVVDAAAPRLKALRAATERAAWAYRYYAPGDYKVDPLVIGRFPDGGATKVLVRELERRARGSRWPACQAEGKRPHMKFTKQFCGAVPVAGELRKYRAALARATTDLARAPIRAAIAAYEQGRIYR